MKKHAFKVALISISSISIFATGVSLTSCSADNKIVFANFSGYMNPNVQTEIEKTYSIQWDEYESNESITNFLKNGTYDTAIATQYKIVEFARTSYQNIFIDKKPEKAIISPIDWNRFNLKDANGKNLVVKDNQTGLYKFDKLKPYFTEQTWDLLTAYNLDNNPNIDENCKDNLLNWTIPYFAQTLSFGYRGAKISELDKSDGVTFKDIFNYFKNPRSEQTLFNKNQTITLIKDERTDYDLARMLINLPIAINNDPNVSTIAKLTNDYRILNNAMNAAPKEIILESDSNVILNRLALNEISGAITYNGDLIYSSLGGDYSSQLEQEKKLPNNNDFHLITPKDTLLCFDGIIFSNKINVDSINNIYEIVKKIFFPTINNKLIDGSDNNVNTINNAFPLDNNHPINGLNYLPLMNFDYVYYNPIWECINKAINLPNSNLVEEWQKPFFTTKINLLPTNRQNENEGNLIRKPDGFYKNIEYPINEIVSSNLNIANYAFINNSVKRTR